jgi:hypothetical protein
MGRENREPRKVRIRSKEVVFGHSRTCSINQASLSDPDSPLALFALERKRVAIAVAILIVAPELHIGSLSLNLLSFDFETANTAVLTKSIREEQVEKLGSLYAALVLEARRARFRQVDDRTG